MLRLSPLWIALACTAAANSPAWAAPGIWRCGNNSYSQTPCEGGQSIDVEAAPNAQRRREAEDGTRRDRAAADRMERERLQLEAQQARQRAVVIGEPSREKPGNARPSTARQSAKTKKPEKPDAFTASYADPSDKGKSKKPRRKATGD